MCMNGFETMDVFIFTLGLTEYWFNKNNGIIFPTAPGTIAGRYNNKNFDFELSSFTQIMEAFKRFQNQVLNIRGKHFSCRIHDDSHCKCRESEEEVLHCGSIC